MNDVERDLPELSDDAVARIELGMLADIERGRQQKSSTRVRRRRGWVGGSLAAAAVVVGAVIIVPLAQQQPQMDVGASGAADHAAPEASVQQASPSEQDSSGERRVIRTGSATIVVDDVASATVALTDLADEYDGYVEDLGSSDADEDATATGWITLRVPADDLDAVRASLADLGDVREERVSSSDVTAQSVDLEARIDSLTASVDRLDELMAKAGSVGDLLEAEQALSERQAELESLQREYDRLGDEVAMSTLSVSLKTTASAADLDPAGFGDGILAGWNALAAFLSGLVVVVGAVLPWLGAVGVVALVGWVIVRIVRRRR
ncbi:MAG: DUF4349 domain-containing protein [Candidatus Microbacterium stercoravium]